jgi:NADH:ubiquinone oxidoreductase subunit
MINIFKVLFSFNRHGWLHSIVDDPPTKTEYQKSIADIGHGENFTGTDARYAPYNTTKPKISEFKLDSGNRWKSLGDKIKIISKK